MQIDLLTTGPMTARIDMKIQEADYVEKVEKQIKEYAKTAQLKGFRPGFVPKELIRKMYGKGILAQTIEKTIDEKLNEFIKEKDLKLVGQPIPLETEKKLDLDNQKEFNFSYEIGYAPEFDVNITPEIELPFYEVILDDEQLKKETDRLRNVFFSQEADEIISKDSIFHLEVTDSAISFHKNRIINPDYFSDTFQLKFNGLKKDDKFEVSSDELSASDIKDATRLLDEPETEFKKLKGNFTVLITGVFKKVPAEVNNEFFKKVFPQLEINTEDEFKNLLKKDFENYYKYSAEQKFISDIYKYLFDTYPINLPDEFLKRWVLVRNEYKLSKEHLDHEYEHVQKNLKDYYLINKIITKYNLQVKQEEILDHTKKAVKQAYLNTSSTELEDELADMSAKKYLSDSKKYEQIYSSISQQKINDFLLSQIKKINTPLSAEEFLKKTHEHRHEHEHEHV